MQTRVLPGVSSVMVLHGVRTTTRMRAPLSWARGAGWRSCPRGQEGQGAFQHLAVPASLVPMAPPGDFDPFAPHTLKRMSAWASARARDLGLDPGDGEDAVQTVLCQIAAGDPRPLRRGERSFKACVWNRLRSERRRRRLHAARDRQRLSANLEPGGAAASAFLAVLGLSCEDELVKVQALVAPALLELEQSFPNHARAFKARLRGQLLECGGPHELEAFERFYGVSLGAWTGTKALADGVGIREGTVAAQAHRGERRLVKIITGWLEDPRHGPYA